MGDLAFWLRVDKHHIVFVIDEARAAVMDCGDYIISETALTDQILFLDNKRTILPKFQQGILSPLVMIGGIYGTVVAASLSVDLKLPDAIN